MDLHSPVLVVGLGRFGAAVALELSRLGREVLAVEKDPALVQRFAGSLTHVVEADATDPEALRQLGADEFTTAVVGVGTSIESSVLATVNLVDLEIPHIWVKAITAAHGKILQRIGANHIIFPEHDAGMRTAHLVGRRMLDFIEFDDDFAIVKMYPPQAVIGKTLQEAGIRRSHGITVVGVKSPGEEFTYATAETRIGSRDVIIASGPTDRIEHFAQLS